MTTATANPAPTCHNPRFITSTRMLRMLAPSAMRTPISCVLRLPACAITA